MLTNGIQTSQWREKQKEVIAERDAESEKRKQETINQAREDIDKFYEEYNDKKQKAIEEHRFVSLLYRGGVIISETK